MGDEVEFAVEAVGLTKHYGNVTALRDVTMRIEAGHYFVLLGPSGGGKTTLLRLISGLIRPSAGRVALHGVDVTSIPANERPTTMVFQSFALFPHMSVANNVGFGLKLRKMPQSAVQERVKRMLELVGLAGYEKRMPHELSGGQQQRVQLARSLVLDRDVLLLDEPLASLDEKLRKDMCLELKRIQEQVGITFIHVTHNQHEAMAVADRIAIIADGRLVEEGSPRDIYERPIKRFTADFVGDAQVFDGRVTAVDGARVRVDIGLSEVDAATSGETPNANDPVSISVHSDLLQILSSDEPVPDDVQTVPGNYVTKIYLGLTSSHVVALADGSEVSVCRVSHGDHVRTFDPGAEVLLGWRLDHARLHTS
ncbi:MAG: ABC transporter ATP-binding protein [Alphaproteobacteria bacterium]|nr:ABC transporter ATP-binding protein [Alphaproteobacteria bacterium]